MPARVLILDMPVGEYLMVARAEPPTITATTREDMWSDEANLGYGGYCVSPRAMDLAETASTRDYDLVVIGNNRGHGTTLAMLLPSDMRPRTLIVWNDGSSRVEQSAYEEMGYIHFGTRSDEAAWYDEQVASL